MKYERLTERDEYGNADIIGISTATMAKDLMYDEFIRLTEALNRLAELEDKIENGTLVELPCKVGDKVCIIAKQGMDIYSVEETTIANFWFNKIDNRLYPIDANGITLNEIFINQAEAEKRLKELRGER